MNIKNSHAVVVAARRHTKRAALGCATICLALVAASCSFSAGTEATEASSEDAAATGSVEQLCATAVQWQQPLADAGANGLGPLAETKVSYLKAAQAAAPATWSDNIAVIIPAWETLVAVIAEANGDASRIDFDKFSADFADATANDAALESFVQSRCLG